MKVYLVCNAGMSTGILQTRLEDEAANKQLDMTIEAIPINDIKDIVGLADIVLMGPQVRFAYNDIKKTMDGVPVIQISPADFGTMNAKKIMQNILDTVK